MIETQIRQFTRNHEISCFPYPRLTAIMKSLATHRQVLLISFQGELICYQRAGDETVPNCSGNIPDRSDFCVDRPLDYLLYVGKDGEPEDAFPLGPKRGLRATVQLARDRRLQALEYLGANPTVKMAACQGDCDDDGDCLVCAVLS